MNSIISIHDKISSQCKKFILFVCVLMLLTMPVWDGIPNKLISVAGCVAFVCVLLNPRLYFRKGPVFFIFLSLFLLGVMNLGWSSLYKEHTSEFINAYRGPMEFGKVALFASFSFLVLLTDDKRTENKININLLLIPALLSQFIFFVYAVWQHFYLHLERVLFASKYATSASYMLVFVSLFAAILITKSEWRYRNAAMLTSFVLGFSAMFMTGTRGAILVFPVLYLSVIVLHSILTKKISYKLLLLLAAVFVSVSFIFKDTITTRMDSLNKDMSSYSQDNSDTSVGARFAMYEAGLRTYSFWGQSLETRAEKIEALDKQEPRIGGALRYLGTHLHNDVIETLSTRGVPGVLLIIFFYLVFAYYAVVVVKDYYLLILLAAPAVLGLSDVILFAKSSPVSLMAVLILLCAYSKNRMLQK